MFLFQPHSAARCTSLLVRRSDSCPLHADPLATDMSLDGECAGRIVQLLTDIFSDPTQLTLTGAVVMLRFMMDLGPREFRGTLCAFGMFLSRWCCFQLLQFYFDTRNVDLDHVVRQADLQHIEVFAALAVRVALQQCKFLRQLLIAATTVGNIYLLSFIC